MFGKYFLVQVMLLLTASTASACVISLAYNDIPSPPFLIGEGAKIPQNPGIAIDIVTSAVAAAGCTLRLVRLPGLRILRMVGDNDMDGAILYSYDHSRDGMMIYPKKEGKLDAERRLSTLSYYLYRHKGSKTTWDGTTLSNPDGLAVGINTGFSVGEFLTKIGVKFEEVKTTEQNLGKLHLDRISGYAMQEHIADPAIQQLHYLDEIEKLPVPLLTKNYYLTFSTKFYTANKELAEKIWTQIETLREPMTHTLLPQYRY